VHLFEAIVALVLSKLEYRGLVEGCEMVPMTEHDRMASRLVGGILCHDYGSLDIVDEVPNRPVISYSPLLLLLTVVRGQSDRSLGELLRVSIRFEVSHTAFVNNEIRHMPQGNYRRL
jgi:hypothetical protein